MSGSIALKKNQTTNKSSEKAYNSEKMVQRERLLPINLDSNC
jgi:hypothetical protein